MTNLYKVNIFWYGAISNLQPEPRYAHVKKWRIWPLHGNEAELKCLISEPSPGVLCLDLLLFKITTSYEVSESRKFFHVISHVTIIVYKQ